MARIQRDGPRNILKRIFGIQGTPGPEEIDESIQAVVELGRRGEFELLKEQGIFPFQAFRARTPAAGQNFHCYIMASLLGGTRYWVIVERVEFAGAAATTIAAFTGTALGATNSAVVIARDMRFTVNGRTDFSTLVQVQDGESAVVPPAVGEQIWQGRQVVNGAQLIWKGPHLIPHAEEFGGVQAQLAFQAGTAAARVEYTFYGYLVPVANQS